MLGIKPARIPDFRAPKAYSREGTFFCARFGRVRPGPFPLRAGALALQQGSPVTKRLCWRVALEPDAKADAVAAIYDLLDRKRSPATAARVEQLIEALGRAASHEYATEPQERDLTG